MPEALFASLRPIIERGLTTFHDQQRRTEYGENVAYEVSSHDPEKCRRCLADRALDALAEATGE